MAQIEIPATGRKAKTFSPAKKQILRIDMTPMVDLGFLLITFFVFTTTVSTPKVADLFMPTDQPTDRQKLPRDLALTLLLDDNNKIHYYNGDMEHAMKANEIHQTGYSTFEGIGRLIRQKQKEIDASRKFKEGRKGMMVIIKPTTASSYKNIVDILDEIMINDVKKYAIVEPASEELNYIKSIKD